MQLVYNRNLRRGMTGQDVRDLQSALVALGYDPKGVDGIFGPGTDAAVRQFQKDNQLVVDGIAGPATYRTLNATLRNLQTSNPSPKVYKTLRRFSSNVHVLELPMNKFFVDVDLGVRGRLETVRKIVEDKRKAGKKIVGGTNGGFFEFNASSEHLGMLIDNGLYYSPPHNYFIDLIYYKNGKVEIVNLHGYDKEKLTSLQRNAYWGIGTSYSLIQNGVINLENSHKFDHAKQRHPRTLLGVTKDDKWLMVVVDGRTSTNLGVTAQQSAEIMRELGAYQAVNLDGGGSSTMVVVENGKAVLKNRPGNPGGAERAVGSVILAYEK
jgi:exopolysaccharide biosynthesis protein